MSIGGRLGVHHPTLFQGQGRLQIGTGVTLGYELAGFLNTPIVLQPRNPGAEIVIGDGTAIMNGCFIAACSAIHIGERCRIGGGSIIIDSDFHGLAPDERDTPGCTAPVVIGDNVLLGVSVTVLKGVTIGKDAIVGAGAVVAKDVPEGAIVVGNSMRIIGSVYTSRSEPA
jgi:maltose O-acetyltransferase